MQEMLASQRNYMEEQRKGAGFMPVYLVEDSNDRRHLLSAENQESSPGKADDET